MADNDSFAEINSGKADFDDIYNQPEPGPYYRALGKLDYRIPGEAKPVLQRVIEARRQARPDDAVTMLDIGCSYGINAALLKHDLDMARLYDWYDDRPAPSAEAAVAADREFFNAQSRAPDLAVVGMDPAERAIGYGVETGLLDAGVVADLENGVLPARDLPALREVDLIAATGAIGYVTEKSFQQLLPAIEASRQPWVACFVLRMFPYEPIAHSFSDHGLVTEKLEGVFVPQRRFADEGEASHVLGQLEAMGIDPEPEAAEGQYVAEFYLSRPFQDVRKRPLADVLEGLAA